MAEILTELRGVTKEYVRGSERLTILDGYDAAFEAGEFVALMGPSGSGKTTILNLLGGLDLPDEGEVLFDGEDITLYSEAERARWRADNVGFVFQSFNLVPVLKAVHNVELPLLLAPVSRKSRP